MIRAVSAGFCVFFATLGIVQAICGSAGIEGTSVDWAFYNCLFAGLFGTAAAAEGL
jgi:hypothetical protein